MITGCRIDVLESLFHLAIETLLESTVVGTQITKTIIVKNTFHMSVILRLVGFLTALVVETQFLSNQELFVSVSCPVPPCSFGFLMFVCHYVGQQLFSTPKR